MLISSVVLSALLSTAPGVRSDETSLFGSLRPVETENGRENICLVTHYSANQTDFAAVAFGSQKRYAKRHGYGHAVFEGHISGDDFVDITKGGLETLRGGGLYWQKIRAVEHVLRDGIADDEGVVSRCDWAMWLDSDVIFTNETIRIEDLIERYALPRAESREVHARLIPTDVILAAEYHVGVCTGTFLVHNTDFGLRFLQDVTDLYDFYKDRPLPEQDAVAAAAHNGYLGYFDWPHREMVNEDLKPGYAITPQRVFVSLPRPPSWPASGRWQRCDLIAHISGASNSERIDVMNQLLETRYGCENE